MLLVAQIGREIAAKGAALRAVHIPLPDAVGTLRLQVKALAVGIKIVVQRIVQLIFIHAQQLVAGRKAKRLGFAARIRSAVDLNTPSCIYLPFRAQKGKALRPPLLNITPMCHQFCAN